MLNTVMIGERIRSQRKKKHITQAELAEKIHCSTSYISHLENGTKCMSFETFALLINALDISADELICESLSRSTESCNRVINSVLADSSPYEAAILYDLLISAQQSLRKNHSLIRK